MKFTARKPEELRGGPSRRRAIEVASHRVESAEVPVLPAQLLNTLQRSAGNRSVAGLVQRLRESAEPNRTGLPDGLKAGIESLSGLSLDHVDVHYNSSEPAKLGALAYTRGGDIYVAPGEERQLPHEAWHAVQQADGRVKSSRTEVGIPVNDDAVFEREADAMGEQARSNAPATSTPTGAASPTLARSTPPADAVAQLARQNIPLAGAGAITLAAIEAIVPLIDAEILELQPGHPEIDLGFIEMDRVQAWRTQLNTRLAALRALNPGAAAYSKDQVSARDTALMVAFYDAVVSASNLRGALNKSLGDFTKFTATQNEVKSATEARETKGKEKETKAAQESERRTAAAAGAAYVSPYAGKVDKYDTELEGAPILVEGHFVIVVEHYQLKHNANLGILQAGGPFKGKKGSSMPGGWSEHRSDYAPQILQMARAAVAKLNGRFDASTVIRLAKERTANMEAYLSITRDREDWVVAYHCNP
jgi:hypothetical protein